MSAWRYRAWELGRTFHFNENVPALVSSGSGAHLEALGSGPLLIDLLTFNLQSPTSPRGATLGCNMIEKGKELGLLCTQHQSSLISRPFFISSCKVLMQKSNQKKSKNKALELHFFCLKSHFYFSCSFEHSCTSALPDFVLFSKTDFTLSFLKHPDDLCFRFFLNHHMLDNCAQRNYFQSGLNTKEKHTANFCSRVVQTFP